jgi:acetyl-CoA synthetase
MDAYAWTPSAERVEHANVTRLMRAAGAETIDDLRRMSVEDIDWFWDLAARDLDLRFDVPYSQVRDGSAGIEATRWFVDGMLNVERACVDRWLGDPFTAAWTAVVAEDETGEVRSLTYAELAYAIDRATVGLRSCGIAPGDVVAIYLPMIPEAVVIAYAVAKAGAIALPLFSGFASGAVAARLRAADAKLVVTADWSWRRGRKTPMKEVVDEAVAGCPSVTTVVVVERSGDAGPRCSRDVAWSEFAAPTTATVPSARTSAEDVLLLGYTSGTSGAPKGAVHTHAGFLVKVASELAYEFDVHERDVFFWMTDMGWVMGPLSVFGTHALGGTLLLYEGAPDRPDPGRLWQLAEAHEVNVLGVSPTLVRALKAHGEGFPRAHDLSKVHTFGSTGEPWDEDSYRWLGDVAGGGRVPIINFSGGTEVGGAFLAPFPVEPIKPCSLGGPSLGMDVDVVDPEGNSVRGQVGELVCRQPWPAMTRGLWRDPDGYRAAYWSTFPGVWRHGDWAKVDDDGHWFLLGRSDEAMNIAGKRVGPAEVESVLCGHAQVAEAAAIGVPDAGKGEAIWCFWTPLDGAPDVSDELAALVGSALGRPFTPARVLQVATLPKTRSAKILRRAIRAAAIGADPGDLSGAENPEALEVIRAAVAASAPFVPANSSAGVMDRDDARTSVASSQPKEGVGR